jgi:hypothetical protein
MSEGGVKVRRQSTSQQQAGMLLTAGRTTWVVSCAASSRVLASTAGNTWLGISWLWLVCAVTGFRQLHALAWGARVGMGAWGVCPSSTSTDQLTGWPRESPWRATHHSCQIYQLNVFMHQWALRGARLLKHTGAVNTRVSALQHRLPWAILRCWNASDTERE